MAADGHLFDNITLTLGGGTISAQFLIHRSKGQLRIDDRGISWKKQDGGKELELGRSDLAGFQWMKDSERAYRLSVQTKKNESYKFNNISDQDVAALSSFFKDTLGITPEHKERSVSGRNWGEAHLSGNRLTLREGGKELLEVPLGDVSAAQVKGKGVLLEFDSDTTGAEKDSLMDMVLEASAGDAQDLLDQIMRMTNVGSGVEKVVVTLDGITMLTPRGLYSVELHNSFLRIRGGQSNDFRIQYRSLVRLFRLPEPNNQPRSFVVLMLDRPIREGQMSHRHVVMRGLIPEDFTTALGGLSGITVSTAGSFRNSREDYGVNAIFRGEGGVLYLLEESLLFLPSPTLIRQQEIEHVEFGKRREAAYIGLLVRLKTGQEHLFGDVPKDDFRKIFNFTSGKGWKIVNSSQYKVRFLRSRAEYGDGITCRCEGRDGILRRLDEAMVFVHVMEVPYTTFRFEEIEWVRFAREDDQLLGLEVKVRERMAAYQIFGINVALLEDLFSFFVKKKHVTVKKLTRDLKRELTKK